LNINNIYLIKKNLDYICNTYLFNIKYNKYYRYNISILSIINNILIDNKINKNLNIYLNIFKFLFKKLIGKYFFINWLNIWNNISNFNKKIKISKKKNVNINFNNYFFQKNNYIIKYLKLYKLYNFKYTWLFENSLIYNIYIIFINIYYKTFFIIMYNCSYRKKK
jgi:hypothetical protein